MKTAHCTLVKICHFGPLIDKNYEKLTSKIRICADSELPEDWIKFYFFSSWNFLFFP
jgi:hypothetical protein